MKPNLDELINQFLSQVCAGKDNLTPDAYRRKLRYLQTYLGERSIYDIDTDVMQSFVQHLQTRDTKQRGKKIVAGKLSPWTIKTVLSTTKHFFRWGFQKNIFDKNPMEAVAIPKAPLPTPKAVSDDTVKKLLVAAANHGDMRLRPRNLALIYLLRDTGGRRLGLSNADVDNLDLDRRRLEVIDKGSKYYVLRLSEPTVDAIRAWLIVRETIPPLDHKLLTGTHGKGIVPNTINTILAILAAHAGITARSNPHAFRHAFARDSLRNHADLSTVSQLMHHSSITVTADYYARWADDELQTAHAKCSPGRYLPPPSSYLD